MNLEQQLQSTREAWLSQESLDPAGSSRLEQLIRKRSRQRQLRRLGTVAATILVVGTGGLLSPLVTSMASDLPWVGGYIQRMAANDQGVVWAEGQGYVLPVGKSVTKNGYTFTVDSILADGFRTELFWSMAGPNLTEPISFPDMSYRFNLTDNPGGWTGGHELVDGKVVGHATLPPLPHSVTTVGLSLPEFGGVKGDWSLSFVASRRALDPLTQVLKVNQPLKGEGYDLTVTGVTIAPTGTTVAVEGELAPGVEIREAELVGGSSVQGYEGRSTTDRTGRETMTGHFDFDRLDSVPETLTFRLNAVSQLRAGGPVLPLQPGAQAEWHGTTFTFESVTIGGGMTKVQLWVKPAREPKSLGRDFPEWALRTQSGEVVHVEGLGTSPQEPILMTLSFPGEVKDAVRLEGLHYAEPLPGPVEVKIPLK